MPTVHRDAFSSQYLPNKQTGIFFRFKLYPRGQSKTDFQDVQTHSCPHTHTHHIILWPFHCANTHLLSPSSATFSKFSNPLSHMSNALWKSLRTIRYSTAVSSWPKIFRSPALIGGLLAWKELMLLQGTIEVIELLFIAKPERMSSAQTTCRVRNFARKIQQLTL